MAETDTVQQLRACGCDLLADEFEALRERLTTAERALEEARKELDAIRGEQPTPSTRADGFEYRITTGQRKAWDGLPDLEAEGWEEYQEWERFDYHEERYWRRPMASSPLSESVPHVER